MTIEQTHIVDFISIDPSSKEVVLSISDHLAWNGEDEHLLLLQEKLNHYLAFVESGEILTKYPHANAKAVRIDVVCAHPFDKSARNFFERASQVVENAGFKLTHQVLGDS
jgi:hypothetical protein